MLGTLVEQSIARINDVNRETNVERFAEELVRNHPEYEEDAAVKLSRSVLLIVLETPDIARRMWELVQDDTCTLEQRCALAATLAYLVAPNDYLPESLPAGYGFVDDALLLRYTMLCNIQQLPPGIADEETEKSRLSILASCVSEEVRPALEKEMVRIYRRTHAFSRCPRERLQALLDRLITDPLNAIREPLPDVDTPTPERWNPFESRVIGRQNGRTRIVSPFAPSRKLVDSLEG